MKKGLILFALTALFATGTVFAKVAPFCAPEGAEVYFSTPSTNAVTFAFDNGYSAISTDPTIKNGVRCGQLNGATEMTITTTDSKGNPLSYGPIALSAINNTNTAGSVYITYCPVGNTLYECTGDATYTDFTYNQTFKDISHLIVGGDF